MIRIYPNPSQGMVEISGLEAGNRIKVYNTLGALVLETPAMQSREVISLDNQSSGIYYIVISNSDSVIGRYKLIKQ
jgi:nitrous oxidase accessory protein NosD